MILAIARLDVHPGEGARFEGALAAPRAIIAAMPGGRGGEPVHCRGRPRHACAPFAVVAHCVHEHGA